jgi:NADH:ubiquinone oxidoreductase subunit H
VIEKVIAGYLYYLYCVVKRNLNFLKIKIEIEKILIFQCLYNCYVNLSIFIIIKFIKIMINSTIISCVAVNNEFNIIGINRKDINVQDTHINEIQEDKEDREDDIREGY